MTVIYIHSSARSGSNRILDFFDLHERTLCRNEPQEIAGDFQLLPTCFVNDNLQEDFLERWRWTVMRARERNSFRDRFERTDKFFFRSPIAKIGQALMGKQRFRKATWIYDREEWDIPSLWFKRKEIIKVIPVLKCISQPHWVLRLHASCPDHYFIHNIRSPAGYLRSWWNRYVCDPRHGGPEEVYRNTMVFIPKILAHFGVVDSARYNFLTNSTLLESELWFWRYTNEIPFKQLSGEARYSVFWYDDISKDPVGQCRASFAAAELEFTQEHALKVGEIRNTLFTKPHSTNLNADDVEAAISHVLKKSLLWPEICAHSS